MHKSFEIVPLIIFEQYGFVLGEPTLDRLLVFVVCISYLLDLFLRALKKKPAGKKLGNSLKDMLPLSKGKSQDFYHIMPSTKMPRAIGNCHWQRLQCAKAKLFLVRN